MLQQTGSRICTQRKMRSITYEPTINDYYCSDNSNGIICVPISGRRKGEKEEEEKAQKLSVRLV